VKSDVQEKPSRAEKKSKVRKKELGSGGIIRRFPSALSWAAWLEKNHRRHKGLWLQLAKKGSPDKSVSYNEALEIALSYGWITGQARPATDDTWLSRFVPRSDKSIWSKINREKAEALMASGKMKPAGHEAVERARKNAQWESAYDSPRRAAVPFDLARALEASPRAKAFFENLDGANRYAILFRILTAKKAENRAKKIRRLVEMLEKGKTIHPPRKSRPRP
jgi:uncharacterized protein YdeI (YjbR/CyaY-like superfamily)